MSKNSNLFAELRKAEHVTRWTYGRERAYFKRMNLRRAENQPMTRMDNMKCSDLESWQECSQVRELLFKSSFFLFMLTAILSKYNYKQKHQLYMFDLILVSFIGHTFLKSV